MANYPMYPYQPQQMGYTPNVYQPQYQQPQPQQQDLQFRCIPVASEEEARGIPADLSGKPVIMTQLNAGRIFVKLFDIATGNAIFGKFRKYEDPPQEASAPPAAAYAPVGVVDQIRQLEETVADLRNELHSLKRRRAQSVEVIANDE